MPGASGPAGGSEAAAHLDRICAAPSDKADEDIKVVNVLARELLLSDAQQSAFKDFQATRGKEITAANARLCANKPDMSSFEGRLVLHQTLLQNRLGALKAENPKLIAFYNGLNAEQKKKFDRIREKLTRHFER